jgi:hypothetical protein
MARSSKAAASPARKKFYGTCFDRVIPDKYHPARSVANASAVAAAHAMMFAKPLGTLDPNAVINAKMALIGIKKWENGHTLTCRFLDGTYTQKSKVQEKAMEWEQYANIKLKFIAAGDAEVRISFSADPGSWSAIGNDCLVESYFPKYQPTMNYGWLRDDTDDEEYRRVVVHEFGHALGCIHEHQSPTEQLKWNVEAVYKAFSGAPNYWSKDDIDHNILQKYSPAGVEATAFDRNSIMLYQFDGSLFQDGIGTPNNTDLSALDKQMIARMYSKT